MDPINLRSALKVLADTLADRGVFAHIAVVGGGALLLEEGLRRPTQDLLRLKLFAAYDEGPASVHFADAVAMHPTSAELEDAERWVVTRFPAGPLPGLMT